MNLCNPVSPSSYLRHQEEQFTFTTSTSLWWSVPLNSAGYRGGAVHQYATSSHFSNCNFASNSAGLLGGAFNLDTSSIEVKLSKARDNYAVYGVGQFLYYYQSIVKTIEAEIEDGEDSVYSGNVIVSGSGCSPGWWGQCTALGDSTFGCEFENCSACPPGRFSNYSFGLTDVSQCEACELGLYSSFNASRSCTALWESTFIHFQYIQSELCLFHPFMQSGRLLRHG